VAQGRRAVAHVGMFIPINSKVAVDDLLHGAIIQSANDACIALARAFQATNLPSRS